MKKTGIWNSELSRVIARLGHSDRLVVCDAGLPIPRGAEVVDLALTRNIPRFRDTLKVILSEAQFESATMAQEMELANKENLEVLRFLLGSIPVKSIPHEEFKRSIRNGETIFFVRTGEATPYANVILVAGVAFD